MFGFMRQLFIVNISQKFPRKGVKIGKFMLPTTHVYDSLINNQLNEYHMYLASWCIPVERPKTTRCSTELCYCSYTRGAC